MTDKPMNQENVLNSEMILEIGKFMKSTSGMNITEINMDHASMCIEIRPKYCDRGRYSVKCFHKPESILNCWIDDADGFPRYYFDFYAMMTEIQAFIEFRGLKVINVLMNNMRSKNHE